MLPLHELLSHAELTSPRPTTVEAVEARRAERRPRCGNLTLFPCVAGSQSTELPADEPRIVASVSNVSQSGLGLVHCDQMPAGLQFDVQWKSGEARVPLRFQVVHSRRTSLGLYRTGARLIEGVMPELPEPSSPVLSRPQSQRVYITSDSPSPAVSDEVPVINVVEDEIVAEEPVTSQFSGIMKYEPVEPEEEHDSTPAPPGTFHVSAAFGVDKTERLPGVTTCGWEREVEIRRDGSRLWIYIHSPGKKNGWGIFVDPEKFEGALDRVQQAAKSPFITTLAA
jgi:hypothetical protein